MVEDSFLNVNGVTNLKIANEYAKTKNKAPLDIIGDFYISILESQNLGKIASLIDPEYINNSNQIDIKDLNIYTFSDAKQTIQVGSTINIKQIDIEKFVAWNFTDDFKIINK